MSTGTTTYGTGTGYPAVSAGTVLHFECAAHGRSAECAECGEAERRALAKADVYGGYADTHAMTITTFGGHVLARITRHHVGERRYTPTGGYWKLAHVTAVAPDGSRWHGSYNWEGGTLVTLRRMKGNGNA